MSWPAAFPGIVLGTGRQLRPDCAAINKRGMPACTMASEARKDPAAGAFHVLLVLGISLIFCPSCLRFWMSWSRHLNLRPRILVSAHVLHGHDHRERECVQSDLPLPSADSAAVSCLEIFSSTPASSSMLFSCHVSEKRRQNARDA